MVLNIAVLGSTNGTDLQYIIDKLESGDLINISVSFVLSNKEESGILKRSQKHNLKTIYLNPKDFENRRKYDEGITKQLKMHEVEVILLIGYMRLMSSEFVDEWKNKVVNIHPSLLPAFAGGMNKSVHRAVLERGCKVTGASLIFIDHGADTGPIIMQRTCVVSDEDNVDTLKQKVQKLEGEMLVDFLQLFRDNRIVVKDDKVFVL